MSIFIPDKSPVFMNTRNSSTLKWLSFFIFSCCLSLSFAQNRSTQDISINPMIDGTLLKPTSSLDLVIIIGDSGPSDRDGNQGYNRSNYLKKLAQKLYDNDIASFRFDKRVVKQLKLGINDSGISFEDFVNDVKEVITYFHQLESFESIYLIGHGQGSLVGMLASTEKVDGFISLCGTGKNIGDTIIDQVGLSAPELKPDTERIVARLKQGKTTSNYPEQLANAFNPETQSFLISWMAYEPKEEIKKLNIPVVVVQGTKDLQTPDTEAEYLISDCSNCQINYVENMNHVLVEIRGDELENYKSYSDPNFTISKDLVEILVDFISTN